MARPVGHPLEALDAETGRDSIGDAAATPDEEWVASRDGDVGSGADDPPE
jgi:hypothetical protein